MESLWFAPHRCSLLVLGFLWAVWMAFFHHSISITHHFKIPHLFGTITQYFSHYLWVLYLSLGATFFFFQYHWTQWKKKEKKKEKRKKKKEKKPKLEGRRRSHLVWKEKEKKEDEETHAPNPVKKKRDGQKLRLKSDSESLHVMLFTEMPLSYELWKLKTAKMCFQFP